MTTSPHVFASKIYRVGLIRFVDVPLEVSRSLGSGHVPVHGFVERLPLRSTLVPAGNGRHRLAIHGDIYRKLRIDAGAVIEISLELDEESREPVLPPSLVTALKFSKVAAVEFRAMTTALRRQIVRHLTKPKNLATVERRVSKFIAHLERNPHYSRHKPARTAPAPPQGKSSKAAPKKTRHRK